jgi:hypothetical protein
MKANSRTFLIFTLLCLLLVPLTAGLSGCTFTVSQEEQAHQQPVSEPPAQTGEQDGKPTLGSTPPPQEVLPWTGVWESGQWGRMELKQSGNTVTGTYTWDEGKIQGTVSDNILRGMWSESPSYSPPDDAGDFEFTLSSDGKSFSGQWRYGSDGDWDGDWNGNKSTERIILIDG